MVSEAWVCDALALRLKATPDMAMQRSLYLGLRHLMEQGELPVGTRLPSSRALARHLHIARNTALAALDQLTHEGFIDTRPGAGSFVAPSMTKPAVHNPGSTSSGPTHSSIGLSQRGQRLTPTYPIGHAPHGAFVPGLPGTPLFPWETWRKLLHRHLRQAPPEWMHYQSDGGLLRLREVLCDYLRLSRSVNCDPEQILITQGAQQGFWLVAQLLANQGEHVWFENPGYEGARAALIAAGLILDPVSVDQDGMQVDNANSKPALIYITPSYQYPCAVTLSLERRRQLLALVEQHDAYIIEDDYDSEFRYDARPLASLQGMSDGARVIYTGTFSKVMYPGIGLGYLVLPKALASDFKRAATRLARASHYPLQAAVADFIADGAFRRHINRCRHAYQQRQQALRDALAPAVERGLQLSPGLAGMHLLATHPRGIDEASIQTQAKTHGIQLKALSPLYITVPSHTGLVLGYAAADVEEIHRAGARVDGWLKEQGC